MRTGFRLTVAGLLVVVAAVVVGVTVIPTHVAPANGSIRCGTVLRPDRYGEVADLCGSAGTNQLRAVLVLGSILAVIAFVPLILQRRRPGRHLALWVIWAVTLVMVTVLGLGWVGFVVEYTPESVFFDL